PRAGRARTRPLGALLLPPRRLGTGDALARPRTAGCGLAADARRGLARTTGRADPRGELLRRDRRPGARLLARARARGATGRLRSLPALLRGSPGRARSHLCSRRRCRLRTARRCLDRAARPRAGEAARPPERRRARALVAATTRERRAARVLAPLAGRAAARLVRERSAGEHRLP